MDQFLLPQSHISTGKHECTIPIVLVGSTLSLVLPYAHLVSTRNCFDQAEWTFLDLNVGRIKETRTVLGVGILR